MTPSAPRTIRFLRAQVQASADDRCQAVVEIESAGGSVVAATAEGGLDQAAVLRAVARAAADAVSEAVGSAGVSVRLRSIEEFEVLGQTLLVVSLVATREGRAKNLHGVCDRGDDPPRAAALAVLNATNRFLGVG